MEKYYIFVSLVKVSDDNLAKLITCIDHDRSWTCPITQRTSSCYQSLSILHPSMKTSDVTVLNRRTSSSNDINSSKWLRLDKLNDKKDNREGVVKTFFNISEEIKDQVTNSAVDSKVLGDKLHAVADTFRASGYSLDVIVQCGSQQAKMDDHIHLYGALRRLNEFYHARITLLDTCQSGVSTCQSDVSMCWSTWQRSVNGRLVSCWSDVCLMKEEILWRGSITIRDGETKILLPNFVLKRVEKEKSDEDWVKAMNDCRFGDSLEMEVCEPAGEQEKITYLSSHLEILETDVKASTVPVHLYTGKSYQLCLEDNCLQYPESASFMEYTRQNPQLSSIVRLSRSEAPSCGECLTTQLAPVKCRKTQKTATEIWKERMQASLQEQVEDLPLPGLRSSRTFLVRSSASGCRAYLLRQPHDYNGSIISQLLMPKRPISDQGGDDVTVTTPVLSRFGDDILAKLERDLSKLQTQVLQDWINCKREQDSNTRVSQSDVLAILTGVRHRFYKKIISLLPKVKLEPAEENVETLDDDNNLGDSSSWIEKLSLMEMEKRAKLPRLDTSRAPEKVADKQAESAVVLDAAEFLKMFLPSGESADTDMSPVKANNRRSRTMSNKYDASCSDKVLGATFDEAVNMKYHDVYYNTDMMCDRKDKVYKNMRERWVSAEYCCTFDRHAPPVTFAMLAAQKSKARKQLEVMKHRYAPVIDTTDSRRRGSLVEDEHRSRILHDTDQINKDTRPSELSALPSHLKSLRRTMSASGIDTRRRDLTSSTDTRRSRQMTSLTDTRRSRQITSSTDNQLRDNATSTGQESTSSAETQRQDVPSPNDVHNNVTPQIVTSQNAQTRRQTDVVKSSKSGKTQSKRVQKSYEILYAVCKSVLTEHGVPDTHQSHKVCKRQMVEVVKCYAKGLSNSQNLEADFRKLAEGQVQFVKNLCHVDNK